MFCCLEWMVQFDSDEITLNTVQLLNNSHQLQILRMKLHFSNKLITTKSVYSIEITNEYFTFYVLVII